jgi:hypothetical protein
MNIAILLSGHFRTTNFKALYDSYEKYIFKVNPSCTFDIFISTWNDTGLRSRFDYDEHQNDGVVPGEIINENTIKSIFNPVYCNIENFNDKKETFKSKTQKIYELRDSSVINGTINENIKFNRILANCSMWYKWFDVEELKQKYQLTTNKHYNVVIKSRCDFIFCEPIDLYEDSNMLTPPWPVEPSLRQTRKDLNYDEELNDWWAIGNEKLITKLNSLYNNYDILFEELKEPTLLKEFINPHRLPVYNLQKQGVKLNQIKKLNSSEGNKGIILSRNPIV